VQPQIHISISQSNSIWSSLAELILDLGNYDEGTSFSSTVSVDDADEQMFSTGSGKFFEWSATAVSMAACFNSCTLEKEEGMPIRNAE
jgi:hypothetical protein